MNIYVDTSHAGVKVVTACHPSINGTASMWVADGREYNTTYRGPLANANDFFKALEEWLDENCVKE